MTRLIHLHCVAEVYSVTQYYLYVAKVSDRQAWANSVDLDQTASLAVWSGSTLLYLLDALIYGKAIMFKI